MSMDEKKNDFFFYCYKGIKAIGYNAVANGKTVNAVANGKTVND